MARSTLPLYPSDDGWPYPDDSADGLVADDEIDLDQLELVADPHAWADLTAAERTAIERRFGFDGAPASMKELCATLGCTRTEAREVLGSAIDKLRSRLR